MARHQAPDSPVTRILHPRVLAVLVTVLAVTLLGFLVARMGQASPRPPSASASRAGRTAHPSPTTVTVRVTVGAAGGSSDLAVAARRLKPLQDLTRGDRVLFEGRVLPGHGMAGDQHRRLCTWLQWGGSTSTSTIQCDGQVFQTSTVKLTPVELAPKD
jgi:hypothetical protein